MKVKLFSKGELPATHKPLCHKSESYIASLIAIGEAIRLECGSAQLTGWIRMRQENADQKAARMLKLPAVIQGRNSCRKVGEMLKAHSFASYPIPACGAHSRPMWVKTINKPYAGPLVWQMNS